MGDEPFTTLRPTYNRDSTRSTSLHLAAYAADRAKVLFGSYRRGDANDPDAYVAAITAVLSLYDADLIREVTDPRTGIMTTEKYMSFMPNAGELKVYCEAEAKRRANLARLGSLPAPDFSRARLFAPEPLPGRMATTFIAANHARYPSCVEWTKWADDKFWRVGKGPDGQAGVWFNFEEFTAGRKPPTQQAAE